jgi:hypothetical protein
VLGANSVNCWRILFWSKFLSKCLFFKSDKNFLIKNFLYSLQFCLPFTILFTSIALAFLLTRFEAPWWKPGRSRRSHFCPTKKKY